MTDFRWNLAIELLESVIINSYFFEEYSRKKNLPSLTSNTIVPTLSFGKESLDWSNTLNQFVLL